MNSTFRELKKTLFNIQPPRPKGLIGFLRLYLRALRFYLLTGLMVWVPLIVTVWLTWWLFKNVGLGIENVIENGYARINELGERVERLAFLQDFQYRRGFGFLIAVGLFLSTGFFARNIIGRRIISRVESLLQRIPGVRGVYKAVQQIRDVFVSREGAVFQKVVLIEYPRKGLYAVAFQTSSGKGVVQKAAGKPLVAVFVPTTPNPTSGFLLYVDPDEAIPIDISVEDAMKLIVSGGAFDPEIHALAKAAKESQTGRVKADWE